VNKVGGKQPRHLYACSIARLDLKIEAHESSGITTTNQSVQKALKCQLHDGFGHYP